MAQRKKVGILAVENSDEEKQNVKNIWVRECNNNKFLCFCGFISSKLGSLRYFGFSGSISKWNAKLYGLESQRYIHEVNF